MANHDFNSFFDFINGIFDERPFGQNSYYSKSTYDEEGNVIKKVEKEYKNGKCVKDYTYEKTDETETKSIGAKFETDEKPEVEKVCKCSKDEDGCGIEWYEKYLALCSKYGELEVKYKEQSEYVSELESENEMLLSSNACLKKENENLTEKIDKLKAFLV